MLDDDKSAAYAFVDLIIKQWMPDLAPLMRVRQRDIKACSWQLAGLAVLADWLGSNQQVFAYCDEVMPLTKYWCEMAFPRAEKSITLADIKPRSVSSFTSIKQQFSFIQEATPLQAFAQEITIPESPQLFILEDVTGAGKTEAAMVLVHRLLAKELANGLYIGLPTMATANGMYKRMSESYRKLYSDEELPSVVLAHGASHLSEDFRESVSLSAQYSDKNYSEGEFSASAYCNYWIADSRKKALLADVGVGTIDQALLGVLPARHQSLRLYGLTGKVLVVDEVHAYDPYVQKLLCALLSAHAAQGGSVILLSATLPFSYRQWLVRAYAECRFNQKLKKWSRNTAPSASFNHKLISHF